jgi:hypothetical protein
MQWSSTAGREAGGLTQGQNNLRSAAGLSIAMSLDGVKFPSYASGGRTHCCLAHDLTHESFHDPDADLPE